MMLQPFGRGRRAGIPVLGVAGRLLGNDTIVHFLLCGARDENELIVACSSIFEMPSRA